MKNDTETDLLKRSVNAVAGRVSDLLCGNDPSVYLYGSAALGDFKPGWSDIDVLVLTRKPISGEQAERLVGLRRIMAEEEPLNPYYRLFEGGMLTLDAFVGKTADTVVYWGTSGQRITDRFDFDSFSMKILIENGVLIHGADVRGGMAAPTYGELKENVRRHLDSIRQYGRLTGETLYSFGWMLDISRCFYTLRTGGIIAKTASGEWALENGVCPVPETLRYALRVRRSPLELGKDDKVLEDAGRIGDDVVRYADALGRELDRT